VATDILANDRRRTPSRTGCGHEDAVRSWGRQPRRDHVNWVPVNARWGVAMTVISRVWFAPDPLPFYRQASRPCACSTDYSQEATKAVRQHFCRRPALPPDLAGWLLL